MKLPLSGLLAGRKARLGLALFAIVAIAAVLFSPTADKPAGKPADNAASGPARPALSVTLVAPQTLEWPRLLPANGNVVAWQEAVIGAEISNYRITEVAVQVGDTVRKGQLLARIASDTVASELAEAKASVAELQASATEAKDNAARAAELREKGFYSSQLNTQYQTALHTAAARLAAGKARLLAAEVKMGKTTVLAPDDGIISARSATVGSLTQPGQELFRLIRGGRLEWRAEVPSSDLASVKAGQPATLTGPGGETVKGTVRAVAPSVDPQTRNGLVYVDLPADSPIRAGMFARGEFQLAQSPALTLPQTAVVLREGFAYAFRLEGSDRVAQSKLLLGRRQGDRVEVLSGLTADARVIENGAGFLADGDTVKVVEGSAKP
jgi:RND family efflux transporter MFP subunit